jgi:hypothetical protein
MIMPKRRSAANPGFCPSCRARRMTDSAALLMDQVPPQKPLRRAMRVEPADVLRA